MDCSSELPIFGQINEKFWHILFFMLVFHILSLSLLTSAASLIYDQATGKLDQYSVEHGSVPSGNQSNPSYYSGNTEELWNKNNKNQFGYLGRLVYFGPPTTFTFINAGLPPVGASNNRFYFMLNKGNPDPSTWREFFLVLRAKGLRHDGVQDDFSKQNTPIATSGSTYALTVGAGSQTVDEGDEGYNSLALPGINNNGSHPYQYPYQAIWIDTTKIHTSERSWAGLIPKIGPYESRVAVSTISGAMLTLSLGAYYLSESNRPLINVFTVDTLFTAPIRFQDIRGRTTASHGLQVATVRYFSSIDEAKITISSDSTGQGTAFLFRSNRTNATFPFNLAYQCTLTAGAAPIPITHTTKTFQSKTITTVSPIDGAKQELYRCDGQIFLYVDSEVRPPVGDLYSTTIYVVIERK